MGLNIVVHIDFIDLERTDILVVHLVTCGVLNDSCAVVYTLTSDILLCFWLYIDGC